MKLSDLYKASIAASERQFEVRKSDGSLSGHHITLIDPFSEKATKAGFMYGRELAKRAEEFNEKNKELLAQCEEAKDFTEFNVNFHSHCQDLHDAYCMEIVECWDFDNKFTEKALKEAITGFRYPIIFSLDRQILSAFEELSKGRAKK